MKKPFFVFGIIFLLFNGNVIASTNQELSTVNTKKTFSMTKLRSIITNGLSNDVARIIIPPGIYRGNPEEGKGAHIVIRGVKNRQIIADGVTMICSSFERAITISNCSNIELRGLTIDYDPLPYTQGDIIAVDSIAGWLDISIHKGYPVRAQSRIDIVDRQTRYRRRGKPFMWQSSAEVVDTNRVRVINRDAAKFARIGDMASLSMNLPPHLSHTMTVENSSCVTLRKVTIYSSNCMGIVLSGGEGNHHIDSCRIIPGPKPLGATESRILSTNADAILTNSLGKGALTENCEIRDAGDDSWSVQSSDYVVLGVNGSTVVLGKRGEKALTIGSRLKMGLDSAFSTITAMRSVRFNEANIATAEKDKVYNAKSGYWKLYNNPDKSSVTVIELEKSPDWKVGESVIDIDHQGNGFILRNNKIRSSGRILIKASGLIEGNDLDESQGIIIRPETPVPGAISIDKVIVRGNTIRESHHRNPSSYRMQAGAICVAAEGTNNTPRTEKCFGQIFIEGNTIQGGNGLAIAVSSTKEVTIKDNHIINPQQSAPSQDGKQFGVDNHAICWLSNCNNVIFKENTVINPGFYLSSPLVLGVNINQIVGIFPTPAIQIK